VNFTAWSVISTISDENSHVLLRSTIGLYSAQLPVILVTWVLFSFVLTIDLLLFILMPWQWAFSLTFLNALVFLHLASTYSALGRIILDNRAMGHEKIIPDETAEAMEPYKLFKELLKNRGTSKEAQMSITQQYRVAKEKRKSARDLEAGSASILEDEKEECSKEI
jgi:hypothetical protein